MIQDDKAFYDVVGRRRSVRDFQEKPVEWEKLRRVLAAGIKAPTYNHLSEFHFIFLRDPEKRRAVLELSGAFSRAPDRKFLDETLRKIKGPYQREVYAYSVPLQERMPLKSPELLIVCFRMEKPLSECKTLFELNNLASVWLVVENILLAMVAEGLYGVTMIPFKTAELKRLLDIPDDYEIATFISISYLKKEPPLRQIDVNLDERIHVDKW